MCQLCNLMAIAQRRSPLGSSTQSLSHWGTLQRQLSQPGTPRSTSPRPSSQPEPDTSLQSADASPKASVAVPKTGNERT
jgi:hypothetical protein